MPKTVQAIAKPIKMAPRVLSMLATMIERSGGEAIDYSEVVGVINLRGSRFTN